MSSISASQVKDLRERTGLGMMECKKALQEADGDIEAAIDNLRRSSGMKAAKKAGRTAADGVIAVRSGGGNAVMLEINSETDFVARDDNFLAFVEEVMDKAMASSVTDVESLVDDELEASREALVQKIGENITVRRIARFADADNLGSYVHSNGKIGVVVQLQGGDEQLARDLAMHVAAVNPQVTRPEDMPAEAVERERQLFVSQAEESGKPAEIIEKMVEGRLRKFMAENSLVEQAFVKDPDVTVSQLLQQAGADILSFVRFEVGEGIEKQEEDFASEVAKQVEGAGQ